MATPIAPAGEVAYVPTGAAPHQVGQSPEIAAAIRATSSLLTQNAALAAAGQLPPEPGTPGAIPVAPAVTPAPAAPAPQATPPVPGLPATAQPYNPWIAPTNPATAPPAPAAPVPTQPLQTPEAAPVQAAPGEPATPPAAPLIDPNTLTPEAKMLWASVNGDQAKFVQSLLEQTGAAVPVEEPEITIPEAPPVDPNQLANLAQRHLNSIPEYRQHDQQFALAFQEHQRLVGNPQTQTPGELQNAEWQMTRLRVEMEVPEVKENPVRVAELRAQEDKLDRDISRMQTRSGALDAQMKEHLQYHEQTFNQTVQALLGQYQEAHTVRETQAAVSRLESAYQDKMAGEWPAAVTEISTRYNIPPQTLDYYARNEALARLEQGLPVQHTKNFVEGFAKRFVATMDEAHRVKSGEYGALAAQRAAGVSGVATPQGQAPAPSITPAATPPTPAPDNRPLSVVMREREAFLRQEMRAAGQQR